MGMPNVVAAIRHMFCSNAAARFAGAIPLLLLTTDWVVPYNLYLTAMYDAHTPVEHCTSITAGKYPCRSMCKMVMTDH
jgi:hypothetical protein